MGKIMRFLLAIILTFAIGFSAGCGIPDGGTSKAETRVVTDGMGTETALPLHPTRVVSIGVSTDDVVLSLIGGERVIGIGHLEENMADEAAKVPNHITSATESVISLAPDLVIVPDWMRAEFADELRSAGLSVYVYRTPGTIEEMLQMIEKIAGVVNEEEKGQRLIGEVKGRIERIDDFMKQIPEEKRWKAVYCYPQAVGGGKGSTFDGLCAHAGLINGAAEYGIGSTGSAGREALVAINPDVIFMADDAYSKEPKNLPAMRQLYDDPALAHVNAIKNKKIYIIDAKKLLSYSQFMIDAMEEMAQDVYGYEK